MSGLNDSIYSKVLHSGHTDDSGFVDYKTIYKTYQEEPELKNYSPKPGKASKTKDLDTRKGSDSPLQTRKSSAGVQTSPDTSWLNIPGVVDLDEETEDESSYTLQDDERKYFIYVIREITPYAKKECVGRIALPTKRRITLEQLRKLFFASKDEAVREAARKKFKFLSESYRLVVQNESTTNIDEVYPTQGIFIKYNTLGNIPFSKKPAKRGTVKKADHAQNLKNISEPFRKKFGVDASVDHTLLDTGT